MADVFLDAWLDVLEGLLAAWLAVCFDVDGRAEGLIGRVLVDDVDDYY